LLGGAKERLMGMGELHQLLEVLEVEGVRERRRVKLLGQNIIIDAEQRGTAGTSTSIPQAPGHREPFQ